MAHATGLPGPSLTLVLRFYWWRLRTQPVQEALAVAGITVGVALIFAIQIANTSVSASVRSLYQELAGKATIEVAARSSEGVSQSLVARVGEAPGVFGAAGVLSAQITLFGPHGSAPLTLYGAEPGIAAIGGALTRRLSLRQLAGARPVRVQRMPATSRANAAQLPAIALPEGPARAIGASPGQLLVVKTAGRSVTVLCGRVLGVGVAGAAAQSPVAISTLAAAQSITGLADRLTRVLVEPQAGHQAQVSRSLSSVLGASLDVRSSASEVALLEQATAASNEATSVFTLLALAVGLLIAYNAMLLTLPARRASMRRLRDLGGRRSELGLLLALEVALLGALAAALGLLLGDLLAGALFGAVPRYLTSGFPIGTQRVITAAALGSALGAGLVATALAAGGPAIGVLRGRPLERARETAQATSSLGLLGGLAGASIGVAALLLTVAITLFAPGETIVSAVALAVALALLLPRAVPGMIGLSRRLALRLRSCAGYVASIELGAVPVRAAAVATTSAVAVYAIVAIGGAANDIRRGVSRATEDIYGGYTVIVSPASYAQTIFQTQPFAPAPVEARIRALPGVEAASALRVAFLDARGHRLFVIAKPTSDPDPISPSQIVEGSSARVAELLHRGGWAALASTDAAEWHLHLGEAFAIPTPTGYARFRLAATIANYGWPGGTLVIGSADYKRLWRTTKAGLLEVRFRGGVSEGRAVRAVRGALAGSGLTVAGERTVAADVAEATNQGMSQMSQIATLMLIAAVLAVIAAMAGAVWQRRPRLAALRRLGVRRSEQVAMIYLETAVVVVIGCLAGLLFGLGGQPLATLYVRDVTGFPEAYSPALALAARTVLLLCAISILGAAALGLALTRRPRSHAQRVRSPIPQRQSQASGPSSSG